MVFKVNHVVQGQSPGSRSTTGSSSRKPTLYSHFFMTSTSRLTAILDGPKTIPSTHIWSFRTTAAFIPVEIYRFGASSMSVSCSTCTCKHHSSLWLQRQILPPTGCPNFISYWRHSILFHIDGTLKDFVQPPSRLQILFSLLSCPGSRRPYRKFYRVPDHGGRTENVIVSRITAAVPKILSYRKPAFPFVQFKLPCFIGRTENSHDNHHKVDILYLPLLQRLDFIVFFISVWLAAKSMQ